MYFISHGLSTRNEVQYMYMYVCLLGFHNSVDKASLMHQLDYQVNFDASPKVDMLSSSVCVPIGQTFH